MPTNLLMENELMSLPHALKSIHFPIDSQDAANARKRLDVSYTHLDAKSSGQTARIFHTELAEDSERKTSTGENYVCLKGCAYMVRTSANENLIKEIEGGIKKEVSISCSASVQKCSVCGANKRTKNCPHTKGKEYAGKTAYVILDKIDVYKRQILAFLCGDPYGN